LYEPDGRLALVDGPAPEVPVCYHGLFRTRLVRLVADRDWETQAHFYQARLEVAWEPRFRPYFLDPGATSVAMADEKGQAVAVPERDRGQAPVTGRSAVTIELRLPALPRSARQLGLLRGTFTAVGPSHMLRFEFKPLHPISRPAGALKQTQEGVTVQLRELRVDEELVTVGLLLEYPADGMKLESFQSWLGNNEIYFEKKDGTRFPPNGGYLSGDQAGPRVAVQYHFEDKDGKRRLRALGDWKLVYRTPARLVEVPVPFEFKGVDLP
jgi:hypothetical protein